VRAQFKRAASSRSQLVTPHSMSTGVAAAEGQVRTVSVHFAIPAAMACHFSKKSVFAVHLVLAFIRPPPFPLPLSCPLFQLAGHQKPPATASGGRAAGRGTAAEDPCALHPDRCRANGTTARGVHGMGRTIWRCSRCSVVLFCCIIFHASITLGYCLLRHLLFHCNKQ